MKAIVDKAMQRSLDILDMKRELLERSARTLLDRETLDEHDLRELIGAPPKPRFDAAAA